MKIRFKIVDENRNSYLVQENSPYCLHYKKGHITTALKNTVGIMVFNTFESADDYVKGMLSRYEILEVDVRGRMKKISSVSSGVSTKDLDNFYNKTYINAMIPFPGTECYPRVKVLT